MTHFGPDVLTFKRIDCRGVLGALEVAEISPNRKRFSDITLSRRQDGTPTYGIIFNASTSSQFKADGLVDFFNSNNIVTNIVQDIFQEGEVKTKYTAVVE